MSQRKWRVTYRHANRAWSIPGLSSWEDIVIVTLRLVLSALLVHEMARREATQDVRHEVSSNYAPPRASNFRFELLMNDSYRKIGTDSAVWISPVRSIHGMRYAANVWWMPKNVYVRARDDNTRNNLILRVIIWYVRNNFELHLVYAIFTREYLIIIIKFYIFVFWRNIIVHIVYINVYICMY